MIARRAIFALPLLSVSMTLAQPGSLTSGTRMTLPHTGLLTPKTELQEGVTIATNPPRVQVMLYPGQDAPGNPWSVWGDGVVHDGRYYSAIGDHLAPEGNAFVFSFDPNTGHLKRLLDLRSVLRRPDGWYTPGKIHSSLGFGKDGWLYFSTHRGSTRTTTAENQFQGGWILRHHPDRDQTDIVAEAPLPMQTLPTGFVDPQRLLFYAGSADGDYREKRVKFLVYDLEKKKILFTDDEGPKRAMIFAPSTGRVYYHPWQRNGPAALRVFDPAHPKAPRETEAVLSMRAATAERRGKVYTVDRDGIWVFNTSTETTRFLGPAAVAGQTYITSIDLDPSGQFLYYVPGAHGGGEKDGCPVVRFDVTTAERQVIAFLDPAVYNTTGYIPMGSYASALSADGRQLFITFNGNLGTTDRAAAKKIRFNACALMMLTL